MSTVARLTLFGSLLSISPAWSADASAIREAATKAVALIQTSQKSWFHKESCESCHQQDLPAMAFRAAREHGIPVDAAAARADAVGAFSRFSNFDRVVQWTDIIDPPGRRLSPARGRSRRSSPQPLNSRSGALARRTPGS